MEPIVSWLLPLVSNHPVFSLVVTTVGFLRLTVKPLMTGIKYVATATMTKKDDELVAAIETSKGYQALLYCLDWFASVKVTK